MRIRNNAQAVAGLAYRVFLFTAKSHLPFIEKRNANVTHEIASINYPSIRTYIREYVKHNDENVILNIKGIGIIIFFLPPREREKTFASLRKDAAHLHEL